jgi:hypothetical protein
LFEFKGARSLPSPLAGAAPLLREQPVPTFLKVLASPIGCGIPHSHVCSDTISVRSLDNLLYKQVSKLSTQ